MPSFGDLPVLAELVSEGFPCPGVYLVEFEPSSLWYETSFMLAAHAAIHGIKTNYHTFMRSPSEIRDCLRKLGVDPESLEKKGLLRLFDTYTVTTGRSPENFEFDANWSANLGNWKDDPFRIFEGSDLGLHIDDNNSIMLRYNDEKFIDWLRFEGCLATSRTSLLLIHSIVAGVSPPAFYREAEALVSGIIDFKSEERDGDLQQLVRVRILRSRSHDSRWRRIQLMENGEVRVMREEQQRTSDRTLSLQRQPTLAAKISNDLNDRTRLDRANEPASLETSFVKIGIGTNVTEFLRDENIEARFEVRASGQQPVHLERIENFPDALSAGASRGGILRGPAIDLDETRLEPAQTHNVSVILRLIGEGNVAFTPRLQYRDYLGRERKETFPPIQLRVYDVSPIMEFLARAFADDYERRRFSIEQAGWRGLLDIVEATGIPKNQVYGDSRYSRGFGTGLENLLRAGFVEHRSFSGKGRGGSVTRVRVRSENEVVRRLVDRLALTPTIRSAQASRA